MSVRSSERWMMSEAGRALLSAADERALGRRMEAHRRRAFRRLLEIPAVQAELGLMARATLKLIGNRSTRHRPVSHEERTRVLKKIAANPACRESRWVLPAVDSFEQMMKVARQAALRSAVVAAAEPHWRAHRQAINELVEHNILLVMSLSRNYLPVVALDQNDLIQEGSLGLIHAAELWDWRREIRFSTYAYRWIRHALREAMVTKRSLISLSRRAASTLQAILAADGGSDGSSAAEMLARATDHEDAHFLLAAWSTPLSIHHSDETALALEDVVADEADGPAEIVETLNGAEALGAVLPHLPPKERVVIEALYGLDGEERSHHQIAKALAVCKSTSANIEGRALERLRDLMAG